MIDDAAAVCWCELRVACGTLRVAGYEQGAARLVPGRSGAAIFGF